jgi:hypothetical protein
MTGFARAFWPWLRRPSMQPVIDVDVREGMMLAGNGCRLFPGLVADQSVHIRSFLDIPAVLVTTPVNDHFMHNVLQSIYCNVSVSFCYLNYTTVKRKRQTLFSLGSD